MTLSVIDLDAPLAKYIEIPTFCPNSGWELLSFNSVHPLFLI